MTSILDRLEPRSVSGCSTIRVGGTCPRTLTVDRADELRRVIGTMRSEAGTPILVLGGCSNVIVSDDGIRHPVVFFKGGRPAEGLVIEKGTAPNGHVRVVVDGALAWDAVVEQTADAGLAGLEFLSGIPGTVGAAPVQNISAYGRALADVLVWLETVEFATGEVRRWSRDDCQFGYRASAFRSSPDTRAIARVCLELGTDGPVPLEAVGYRDLRTVVDREGAGVLRTASARRAMVLGVRREKSMVVDPMDPLSRSVGSFFVSLMVDRAVGEALVSRVHGEAAASSLFGWYSDGAESLVKVPAAIVLLAAGFRNGDQWGAVRLSDKHVLALVNTGEASATDVWLVAEHIRATVRERCGQELVYEPRFMGDFPVYDRREFERTFDHRPGTDGTPTWVSSTIKPGPAH